MVIIRLRTSKCTSPVAKKRLALNGFGQHFLTQTAVVWKHHIVLLWIRPVGQIWSTTGVDG
jgi:hypothetical protein